MMGRFNLARGTYDRANKLGNQLSNAAGGVDRVEESVCIMALQKVIVWQNFTLANIAPRSQGFDLLVYRRVRNKIDFSLQNFVFVHIAPLF
mgnify:CR=1 FL=1